MNSLSLVSQFNKKTLGNEEEKRRVNPYQVMGSIFRQASIFQCYELEKMSQ